MTTYDGVRIEAERRLLIRGKGRIKVRDLSREDFHSYEALELATGIDFKTSDMLALELGISEKNLAINALMI